MVSSDRAWARWLLIGLVAFGLTLALLYAINNPGRLHGITVSGPCVAAVDDMGTHPSLPPAG